MTTKVLLTNSPVKVVDAPNWALLSTKSGIDFKIHVGTTVTDANAFHLIREIGFGVGVTVWAWVDGTDPVYVDISQG